MEVGEVGDFDHRLQLYDWLFAETTRPLSEEFFKLTEALKAIFPQSWQVVLLYGSSLRTGDLRESIADFYILVSDDRDAYPGKPLLALANRLLPPNVFYLELDGLRAKYAVVSLSQFQKRIENGWHPYFYGRFCQPVRITAYRSGEVLEQTLKALVAAGSRMVEETVSLLPVRFDTETLWVTGLKNSYESELRAEKSLERARELYGYGQKHFERLTPYALSRLPYPVHREGTCLKAEVPLGRRLVASWNWRLRKVFGKVLSLLRLLKAFFTYRGGVDYLLWKLERHSGKKIEIPERVKCHPFLYGWPYLLKLYREGVFR